jgi:NADPH-dependent 2,4-dienoyl-CoA reductase/sulfur reductase-like enzyme
MSGPWDRLQAIGRGAIRSPSRPVNGFNGIVAARPGLWQAERSCHCKGPLAMSHFDCLIVGGGHGGAQAAILLRQLKFAGTVGLIGGETELPYERPPLSKDYLAGEKPFERLLIRLAGFWAEREITMMLGERVAEIEPSAHQVRTTRDRLVTYGKLIWAGGGAARPLSCPGAAAAGLFAIRSRADGDALRAALPTAARFVVVGGGYIGLEAAAVLTKLGKAVTLVEAQDRLLSRTCGPQISAFFAQEHRSHGVELRLGSLVAAVETDAADRASGVRLATGEVLPADAIIVGIGIVPEVAPLLLAGAAGGNGIDVDAWCRTSLDDIYAIGDCAAHENGFAGGQRIRLESVQNASDQARTAVQHILGAETPYTAVPWFWSNQYDLKLQTVGIAMDFDQTVLRGDPAARTFSVVYLRGGHVIALDCVNQTRDYVQGRAHVIAGSRLDLAQLADPAIPLKEVGLA